MSATAKEKGDKLEEVVAFIENIIFANDEKSNIRFWIDRKKFFYDRIHEIDIVVKVEVTRQRYEYYLIECKNRTEKVDKNDIIVLERKLRDYQKKELKDPDAVVKGVLVGTAFTRPARVLAKEDRIEIVVAEEILESVNEIGAQYFDTDLTSYDLLGRSIFVVTPLREMPIPPGVTGVSLKTQGVVDLHSLARNLFNNDITRLIKDFVEKVTSSAEETGIHNAFYELVSGLEEPVLYQGVIINAMELRLKIMVRFSLGAFESGFDIHGKRRIITTLLEMPFGNTVNIRVVSKSRK